MVGCFKQGKKGSGSITVAIFFKHEQLLTIQAEIFNSGNYLANLYTISYECSILELLLFIIFFPDKYYIGYSKEHVQA